jgi:hypothetical protein
MRAVITKLEQSGSAVLPENEIEATLRQWWNAEVQKGADDPFAKQRETAGTLYDVLVEVDSLTIIGVLADLGKIVGFKVPPSIIKRGGYSNCDEMVAHLSKGLRECVGRKRTPPSKKDKKHAV